MPFMRAFSCREDGGGVVCVWTKFYYIAIVCVWVNIFMYSVGIKLLECYLDCDVNFQGNLIVREVKFDISSSSNIKCEFLSYLTFLA
jgi:hypothetical protein